jgi:hypothetical protein
MRKEEQASLISALSYCSLRELPPACDGNDYWLEALARVAYNNGSNGYVYVKRNETTLELEVKKTFCDSLGIAIILEYYPFEFLRDEFNPKLDKKDDKIKYLSSLTTVDWIAEDVSIFWAFIADVIEPVTIVQIFI